MKIELIHILVGLGVLVGFVGVLITIGIIIFKVSGWTHKVNTGVDQVDKFTQITDTIRGDINAIREKIAQIFGLLREPLGRESPLKLTDFGEKISADVNAKQWAGRTALILKDNAEGKEEYEIYELCKEYVKEGQFLEDAAFRKALHKGAYENGVDFEKVLGVLAVELRDALIMEIEREASGRDVQ